jgi:hypothetical protein
VIAGGGLNKREQRAAKVLEGRVGWEAIVKAVEQEKVQGHPGVSQ